MILLKKLLGLLIGKTESNSINDLHLPSKQTSTPGIGANPLQIHNEEVSCTPTRTFNVIVVGVSNYQKALGKVCHNKCDDGLEMFVRANIVPEEGNPYDSNAVRIEVEGETVGYLSRENALKWRGKMISEGISEAVACPAKIKWDRNAFALGSYGIWLDLDLTLSNSVPFINTNERHIDLDFQQFLEGDGIVFYVDNFRLQDVLCTGTSVKLWIPKAKSPDTVYIYDRSSPYGPFGIVPSQHFEIIVSHLMADLDYDARIVELTYNKCQIKCRLISREETKYREEESRAVLRKELTKPYHPKKPINLTFAMKTKKGAKVGDRITIAFEDIDSYRPYPCQWHISFLNQAGDMIGSFSHDRNIIQRLLKAHFNSFLFDIEVLDVAKERSIAWKGYPTKLVITPYKSHGSSGSALGHNED